MFYFHLLVCLGVAVAAIGGATPSPLGQEERPRHARLVSEQQESQQRGLRRHLLQHRLHRWQSTLPVPEVRRVAENRSWTSDEVKANNVGNEGDAWAAAEPTPAAPKVAVSSDALERLKKDDLPIGGIQRSSHVKLSGFSDSVQPRELRVPHKVTLPRRVRLLESNRTRTFETLFRTRHRDRWGRPASSWFMKNFATVLSWAVPLHVPFIFRQPSDDVNDTTDGDVIKEVEEMEDGLEEFEEYEKRKWLHIFESNDFFDWALFALFALFFLFFYYHFVIGLPSLTKYHGLAIFGWGMMAILYNAMMYAKLGYDASMVWLNGYLLELIFSLENIFVFHVIIESFGTPTRCAKKALFLIVCCQIVFEMVLYMGVADAIASLELLPYILGGWLLYLGIHSAFEDDDHSSFDILETNTVRTIRRLAGNRLVLEYDKASSLFRWTGDGCTMTMLGLVFFCLLMADFFLEIDVTLTKMEQSRDEYLSFTSSALAGFAVPELFFVARDLFRRFPLLKYGISFVLVFYGIQMLLPGLIELSPIEGCGVIVAIMLLCIMLSVVFGIQSRATSDGPADDVLESVQGQKGALRPQLRNYSFVFDRQSQF
mmetsp:Transcript_10660/g.28220  ORF Transcript_10660/g.28220 Transcript_10660/m.28220 type:complete len:598 (-) Transcript_10660:160-1953(-)